MSAPALAGLDPCVHCGFCLQSCPTYLVTSDEADSPRGRIVLMRSMASGRLDRADPTVALHLDRCLGCRACVPVCPSGVQYGAALEAVRHDLTSIRPIPRLVRVIHGVMGRARMRRPALAVAKLARPMARALAGRNPIRLALGMLAATTPATLAPRRSQHDGGAPTRSTAVLFRGCIMEGLFSHVHDATRRVLAANGIAASDVAGQECCGALHAHAGQHDDAIALARRNVEVFATVPKDTAIVINAAGCGAMLKEYKRLLANDPLQSTAEALGDRVKDISEVLAAVGLRRGALPGLRVAYDPPCHLLHAQGVAHEPLDVLDAIDGLERISHEEAELCCGSAGSFTFSQPEISGTVLDRKIAILAEARPDVVATGNPGCIMQIGAGLRAAGLTIPVVHPVELLDASYQHAGHYDR